MNGPGRHQPSPVELAELQERILSEHRDQPHPEVGPGALKAHLLIHAMVERQLLLGDPPETAAALERLLDTGLDRHQAIHRIGQVITREALGMLKQDRQLDQRAYVEALRKLGRDAAEPDR